MSFLTSQIYPSLKTLKILSDVEQFEKWKQKNHPSIDSLLIYEGYKFSIECCLNAFLHGIAIDQLLGIKNNFLLNCAISELIPLHQVENSCEKTVFLKHIKPYVKKVQRSQNYKDLKTNIDLLDEFIFSKFNTLFDDNIILLKKTCLTREIAEYMLIIDFVHTYLVQINNNGPTANLQNPISPNYTPEDRMKIYFQGYKFAIQFLLFRLLGEEIYSKSKLQQMHLADSWRKYKYIEKEKTGDIFTYMFENDFKVEEQTCFDSYFYHIQKEIIDPLTKKYNVEPYTINQYFRFSKKNYNKRIFSDLLIKQTLKKHTEKLNWEDQIKTKLYWFPLELVDSRKSQLHHGISAFNTMLAGSVALHKPKESEFSQIVVAKFIHPVKLDKNEKGNNYSYGILVDTKSAANHYSSGWVIYQDACGDWSGFSNSEHKTCEMLIKKYKKERKIILRKLTIPLADFQKFTNRYALDPTQLSIIDQNKRIPILIQKSRSYLFELFVYYVCNKYYRSEPFKNKNYKIELNSDKNSSEGEKDVVISNNDEIILIECKLTPQNYNMKEMLQKLNRKLKIAAQPKKSAQFWFWNDLSIENIRILEEEIKLLEFEILTPIIVSKPRGEVILRGVSLSHINEVMKDYLSKVNDNL